MEKQRVNNKFLLVAMMSLLMFSATACNLFGGGDDAEEPATTSEESMMEEDESMDDDSMMEEDEEEDDDAMMEEDDAMEEEEETADINAAGYNLPEGFPADMPILDGAEVTGSNSSGSNYSANLLFESPEGNVYEDYKTELEGLNWAVVEEQDSRESSNQRFLTMEKTDDRRAILSFLYMDGGNVSVRISVQPVVQ